MVYAQFGQRDVVYIKLCKDRQSCFVFIRQDDREDVKRKWRVDELKQGKLVVVLVNYLHDANDLEKCA